MSNMDDIFDSAFVGAPGDIILLPLMGYPSERDAMFIAIVTAEYFGSDLHVLHVANKNPDTEKYFLEQKKWLSEQCEKLNIKIEFAIKDALQRKKSDKIILEEIETLAPKLTVMMSRRKGLLQKLSGSIAEKVARESPYSVIIVRSPLKDWTTYGSQISPRKIVVPIGSDSPCELFATQLAIAVANAGESRDAEITLLHVIIIPETVPINSADEKMLLHEEKKFIKQAGQFSTMLLFPMRSKVVVGRDVGRSVSSYVNKEHVDLVIMGVPYLPRKVLGLYGTDTNEIFHKSKCPVVMLFRKSCS